MFYHGWKIWLFYSIFVVGLLLDGKVECKRYGGGSRSFGRSSYSRPSHVPSPSPSYSRPSSYSHPSPSYTHPSPSSLSYPSWHPAPATRPASTHTSGSSSNSRPIGFEHLGSGSSGNTGAVGPPKQPSTNYGFNTGSNSQAAHGSNPPSYGFKPSAPPAEHAVNSKTLQSSNTASHASNPPSYGFKASAPPAEHATNTKPLQNSPHDSNPPAYGFKPSAPPSDHAANSKPLGGSTITGSGNPPPYGFKPSAPVGPPTNAKPVGYTPPGAPYSVHPPPYSPHNPGIPPPSYNPAYNPAGYGAPPAYNPAGYGHPPAYSSYPQQSYHPGGYGGYSYPSQHYSSPGVTNININNINTNSYHHPYGGGYGYGGGYSGFGYHYPSYHYSSSDVGSGTLGFFLGYSLAKITTPTYHSHSAFYDGYTPRYDHYEVHHYYHNRDSIPAQSTIQPNTIVGCIGDSGSICPSGTTSLCTSNGAILCVASASSTVPCTDPKQGNCVKTVVPCVNGTGNCQTGENQTITIPCISKAQVPGNITYVNNTIIVNQTTIINNHGNDSMVSSNSSTVSSASTMMNSSLPLANLTDSLLQNITTTVPNMMGDGGNRSKREAPTVPVNDFCVTILALPAERKPTEQDELVKKGSRIFSKFLVRALGIH